MAKDNNLQDFLVDIANAIREKKGTTEKINPLNFALEISELSVDSGSGESSAIEYFEHTEGTDTTGLILFATYLKINLKDRGRMICPFSTAVAEMLASTTNTIIAAGINLHEKCIGDTGNGIVEMTVKDLLIQNGYTQERLDAIPRITKEEFYSLEPIL